MGERAAPDPWHHEFMSTAPDGGGDRSDACARRLPFICPICGNPLRLIGQQASCPRGHSYDQAREGYLNLLQSGRRGGRDRGDSIEMVRARRRFMARGHYDRMIAALAASVADHLVGSQEPQAMVLDMGCGEGTVTVHTMESVTRALPDRPSKWAGIDISRPAIQYAARRARCRIWFAVANLSRVPVGDHSVEVLMAVFSHVNVKEARRLLSPRGRLAVVGPGARHLFEIRSMIYPSPIPHDERVGTGVLPGFRRIDRQYVKYEAKLDQEDIRDVIHMTPYAWIASRDRIAQVERLPSLVTSMEFYVDSFMTDEAT